METLYLKTLMIFIGYLSFFAFAYSATNQVNIGAMLSSNKAKVVQEAVDGINNNPDSQNSGVKLNATSFVLSLNPIRAALDTCENLIAKKVYLVLVGGAKNTEGTSAISVSYTCSFYRIPVIGVTARESIFSDKTVHHSFLRTVPPYSEQAFIWLGILTHFSWNKVVVLINKDQDSRAIYSRFSALAEKNNINIEKVVIFASGATDITKEIIELENTQSRVILFSASSADAALVYNTAASRGMSVTGSGYIWLVTEQAISGPARVAAPQGVIGVELEHGDDEEAQIHDAVRISAKAINTLINRRRNLSAPPASCQETSPWSMGEELYKELINTTLENGRTGKVAFNSAGDREGSLYRIVNKHHPGNTSMTRVGNFSKNTVTLNNKDLIWPGGESYIPNGIFVSNHLRVVTLMAHPFVYVKPLPPSGVCKDLDEDKKKHVYCTGPLYTAEDTVQSKDQRHCCTGFCMDLLIRLAAKVNFTYSVHLSEDGNFGALKRVNGTDKKKWNGMVGEIIDGKADLIVASLTINNERAQWIEFSKPFKYQGLTILVKKPSQESKLDSFLKPFQLQLWLLVLLSVHVVAVILYLLDRFSPFGRFKLARKEKEETALNLSSAMWFSWGVLLNSGIGEGTPRSFSARVLGMVWAGFAMIIVASYTANLAAFLVLDRPRDVVSGIDDPNLRNPSESFKYATVANSSVDAYFRRQVELSSMYNFMETFNTKTDREGIDAVKSGELKAFIWDSPVLYYEASLDCDLTTAGELFGRSGYGVGMPKKSPWSEKISLAILNFHESGVMEELETSWIDIGNCQEDSDVPATLGLNHMLGVFIMVGAGIGAGIVIIILEILYHKHRGWKEEQKELAKKTTDRWRANIQLMKKDRAQHPKPATQNGGVSRRNPIYTPENQANGQLEFPYNN